MITQHQRELIRAEVRKIMADAKPAAQPFKTGSALTSSTGRYVPRSKRGQCPRCGKPR